MMKNASAVFFVGGLLVAPLIGPGSLAAAADPKGSGRDARQVAEAYLAAAVAGKTAEAASLAEPGSFLSRKEGIARFKYQAENHPGSGTLQLETVLSSEKQGTALAVSAPVNVKRDESGRDTARLVFTLTRTKKGWAVRYVLCKSHEDAKDIAEDFRKSHADARLLPGKPAR
jgi:hypothetical protein